MLRNQKKKHLIAINAPRKCGVPCHRKPVRIRIYIVYAKLVTVVFIATTSTFELHAATGRLHGESQKDIIIIYEHGDKDWSVRYTAIGTMRK